MRILGGIEAGGTKFVCAVGTGPDDVRSEIRFPTTTPEETIGRAIAFFEEQARQNELAAIGISAFGPVDPNPASPTFGFITSYTQARVDQCRPGRRHRSRAGTAGGLRH